MTKTLDGAFSLQQLKDTIMAQENLGFLRIKNIEKRPVPPPANVATFDADTNPAPAPTLVLMQILPTDDLPTIIAQQLAQSRKLILDSTVYIELKEARLAAFR